MMLNDINYAGIKCDFCKGGIVKNVKSLEKLNYKGMVYIFDHVPVGVCNNCGEHYVHAKVIDEMENIVDKIVLPGALPRGCDLLPLQDNFC